MIRLVATVLSCLLALGVAPALADDAQNARVDKLFAAWDEPDTPGAALAVVRDGQIVYKRGYGLAHLEYGVRNTPSTVFDAASLSKQFTAFAIHLLAQDGKLSLDDEVRKHVPELQVQVQGPPITIRHLLHHSSGVRDQLNLLLLAGLRLDDVITEGDILSLLWQQKQLNFSPGDEALYSNSGFTLLGLIVKRVSGKSLAIFAQERIFGPLGMNNTHFHESYGALVKGRAYSYRRTGEGYQYIALSFSNIGASSLMTTVEDLALWDRNYDDARVGGPALQLAMLVRGKLNAGRESQYASGLIIGLHRGLNVIEHSGSIAGYRAHFLRLPDQRLTVLLLGNASDLNAGELSRRVADIYLEGTTGAITAAQQQTFPAEVEMDARTLAPYLGDFEMRPGFVLTFTAEDNRLMVQATGQPKFPMFASANDRFFTKAFESSVAFDAPAPDGATATATWRLNGRDLTLRRIRQGEAPTAQAMQACVGDYYSDELRTLYSLSLREGKLVLRYPRGALELKPVTRDVFSVGFPLGSVRLQRNAAGACEGLAVSNERLRNLRFVRVTLPTFP